jgi:hypothetical protein
MPPRRSTKRKKSSSSLHFPSYSGPDKSKDINHYFREAHGRPKREPAGVTDSQKARIPLYMVGSIWHRDTFFQVCAKLISSWHSDRACIAPSVKFKYNLTNHTFEFREEYEKPRAELESLCKRHIVIAIPVMLLDQETRTGHSNLLLANKETKTIEHFEPHGKRLLCEGGQGKQLELEEFTNTALSSFALELFPGFEWISRKSICPTDAPGPQRNLDGLDKGYCQIWGLWYLNLRLSAPNIPPEVARAAALKKITEKNLFMHDFASYLIAHYIVAQDL